MPLTLFADLAEGNVDLIRATGEHSKHYDVSGNDLPGFEHFPLTVQRAGILTATFCKAYANVTGAIVSSLSVPGVRGIPTADNVASASRGSVTTFFSKGGRVEHALDYLLTTAAEGACGHSEQLSQTTQVRNYVEPLSSRIHAHIHHSLRGSSRISPTKSTK